MTQRRRGIPPALIIFTFFNPFSLYEQMLIPHCDTQLRLYHPPGLLCAALRPCIPHASNQLFRHVLEHRWLEIVGAP